MVGGEGQLPRLIEVGTDGGLPIKARGEQISHTRPQLLPIPCRQIAIRVEIHLDCHHIGTQEEQGE